MEIAVFVLLQLKSHQLLNNQIENQFALWGGYHNIIMTTMRKILLNLPMQFTYLLTQNIVPETSGAKNTLAVLSRVYF
jgi:hypothetical protein